MVQDPKKKTSTPTNSGEQVGPNLEAIAQSRMELEGRLAEQNAQTVQKAMEVQSNLQDPDKKISAIQARILANDYNNSLVQQGLEPVDFSDLLGQAESAFSVNPATTAGLGRAEQALQDMRTGRRYANFGSAFMGNILGAFGIDGMSFLPTRGASPTEIFNAELALASARESASADELQSRSFLTQALVENNQRNTELGFRTQIAGANNLADQIVRQREFEQGIEAQERAADLEFSRQLGVSETQFERQRLLNEENFTFQNLRDAAQSERQRQFAEEDREFQSSRDEANRNFQLLRDQRAEEFQKLRDNQRAQSEQAITGQRLQADRLEFLRKELKETKVQQEAHSGAVQQVQSVLLDTDLSGASEAGLYRFSDTVAKILPLSSRDMLMRNPDYMRFKQVEDILEIDPSAVSPEQVEEYQDALLQAGIQHRRALADLAGADSEFVQNSAQSEGTLELEKNFGVFIQEFQKKLTGELSLEQRKVMNQTVENLTTYHEMLKIHGARNRNFAKVAQLQKRIKAKNFPRPGALGITAGGDSVEEMQKEMQHLLDMNHLMLQKMERRLILSRNPNEVID